MKKIIVFTLFACLFGINTFSQKVKFGAKVGLNLSLLSEKSGVTISTGTTSKSGFLVGGLAEIKLNNKFSLQPEIMYTTDGGQYNYSKIIFSSIVPYNYSQKIDIKTILLPIVAKYYVTPNISIEGGFNINYILKAESTISLNAPPIFSLTGETTDFESEKTSFTSFSTVAAVDKISHDYGFNKLNYGLNLGASYNLKKGFILNARYNYTLTAFTKNANALTTIFDKSPVIIEPDLKNTEIKNSNFQFSVGYKF